MAKGLSVFAPPDDHPLGLSWLIRLRWGAIASQLATVLVVHYGVGITLPLGGLVALIAVEAVTNVASMLLARQRRRRIAEWWLGGLMSLDVILFSGLLYLTGGPSNPFSFLYLVQIALATMVLSARWAWTLVALSLLCSAMLFVAHQTLRMGETHADHMVFHLRGMWVALGVAAGFIVYFMIRIRGELTRSRSLAARQERLASLATLAAGAAHELATPLSSIAILARELERHLLAGETGPSAVGDARLVREEVERCRAILQSLAADAGATAADAPVSLTVSEVVTAALSGLAGGGRVRVVIPPAAASARISAPAHALAQAVRNPIKNALESSGKDAEVTLEARLERDLLQLEVRDRGTGMPQAVLERAGEPFFTTKEPGNGMGLGLFLTRTVLEQLGGSFRLLSRPQHGSTAFLTIPLASGESAVTRLQPP